MKLGRGPIATAILAVAALATYFGTNLVNPDPNVGIVAKDRALVVIDVTSEFSTGASTNTLFLNSPFDANADDRGYVTGTGFAISGLIEIVANPTGASFDCYYGTADTSTGAGVSIRVDVSATGTIIPVGTGHVIASGFGYGCNTSGNITSSTVLKAGGVFLKSAVLN